MRPELKRGRLMVSGPPIWGASHLQSALRHFQSRRLDRAEAACRDALKAAPRDCDVHYLMGVIHAHNRKFEAAAKYFGSAIALNPGHLEAEYNRGVALYTLGRDEPALESFARVTLSKPGHAEAWNNLGCLHLKSSRISDALDCFSKAAVAKPNFAEAHSNRGATLMKLRRAPEALESLSRAVQLTPSDAQSLNNRGLAHSQLRQIEAALSDFDAALNINANLAEVHYNRAVTLIELRRFDEARCGFERSIELRANYAEAHSSLALLYLLLGEFEQGWKLYEWRKRLPVPQGARAFNQPVWIGQSLSGATLFIHSEQGLGDVIQFCRYAVLAAQGGARVLLSVPDALVELIGTIKHSVNVVDSKHTPEAFDYHCALMSMPLGFGTNAQNVPATGRYLAADDMRAAFWRNRLDEGFKIGIAWQGAKLDGSDDSRSCPLSMFGNLSLLPDIRLISLQKGDGTKQLSGLPPDMRIESLGEDFDAGPQAFRDCAAVMESLDLVISIDTSIAHLAGALGRPVWILLKKVPDWRWGLDGVSTPWYPSARLYRQTEIDDWASAFSILEQDLKVLLNQWRGERGYGR